MAKRTRRQLTAKERSQIAALLGSIRTPKKAAASRENGKKGGRPKGSKKHVHGVECLDKSGNLICGRK